MGGASHEEMLAKLLTAVEQHHICYEQWAADETVTTTAEEQAAAAASGPKALAAAQKKKRQLETQNEMLQAKAKRAAAATSFQLHHKRQSTCATAKIQPIDDENKEELSIADKSTAMTTPFEAERGRPGGLCDCIQYWARGSVVAVFQLVMGLIAHFHLEEKVRQQLGAEQDLTNQYIVNRARNALSILKCCDSERQRREYRIVLTANSEQVTDPDSSSDSDLEDDLPLGILNTNDQLVQESLIVHMSVELEQIILGKCW